MGIYPWNKFWYLACETSVVFPPELLLHNYKCGGYVPCVTVNTHTNVNWKNSAKCYWRLWHITNMKSYEDFQFEILRLDVIWFRVRINFDQI